MFRSQVSNEYANKFIKTVVGDRVAELLSRLEEYCGENDALVLLILNTIQNEKAPSIDLIDLDDALDNLDAIKQVVSNLCELKGDGLINFLVSPHHPSSIDAFANEEEITDEYKNLGRDELSNALKYKIQEMRSKISQSELAESDTSLEQSHVKRDITMGRIDENMQSKWVTNLDPSTPLAKTITALQDKITKSFKGEKKGKNLQEALNRAIKNAMQQEQSSGRPPTAFEFLEFHYQPPRVGFYSEKPKDSINDVLSDRRHKTFDSIRDLLSDEPNQTSSYKEINTIANSETESLDEKGDEEITHNNKSPR